MQTAHHENLISPDAADRLIAAHDSDVALLYIYYTRTGCFDAERAARDLCRTMNEIQSAQEKLSRMGLLSGVSAAKTADAEDNSSQSVVRPPVRKNDERYQFTASEIAQRSGSDSVFRAILTETEQVMGRKLSSSDTRILFNIYDTLALPFDVFMLLLHFCAEKNNSKYHGQRKLTASFIENEAFDWAEKEILTIEQAEEYIQSAERRSSESAQIAAVIGMGGKALTKSVQDYINGWIDMGFDSEVVAIAYDRTMLNIGKLSFPYIKGILERWKNNGLMTVKEINEKDPPRTAKTAAKPANESGASISLDSLQGILDKF